LGDEDVVVVVVLGVFDFIASLRRLTEEREMRRRGLSLDRRIGLLFGGRVGDDAG
jgi:hypothetical protein